MSLIVVGFLECKHHSSDGESPKDLESTQREAVISIVVLPSLSEAEEPEEGFRVSHGVIPTQTSAVQTAGFHYAIKNLPRRSIV